MYSTKIYTKIYQLYTENRLIYARFGIQVYRVSRFSAAEDFRLNANIFVSTYYPTSILADLYL